MTEQPVLTAEERDALHGKVTARLSSIEGGAGRLKAFTFERYSEIQPSTAPWRIKGLIPATGMGFLVGESKSGKTFVALDTSLRLAARTSTALGRPLKPCGVVYVASEDPEGCKTRVAAWRARSGRREAIPFELVPQGLNLLNEDEVREFRARLAERALAMAEEDVPLGLIVIDTLSASVPGSDENSSTDMSKALDVLVSLGRPHGAFVLCLAHFGKSGADRGIRGWSGLGANADVAIFCERDKDAPDLRTVTFDKVKNGRDGHRLAFHLEEVDTGFKDADCEPIMSCIAVFEDGPAPVRASKARKRNLTPPQQIVWMALKYVTDHGQTHPVPMSAHGAKAHQKAVTVADVRARAEDAGLSADADKSNTKYQRFHRALEGVIAAGLARQEGVFIWAV